LSVGYDKVAVLIFELRQTDKGFILTGGDLPAPLPYPEKEYAIRLVGFLSQQKGSELRIFGPNGELIETQTRKPAMPLTKDSLGSIFPTFSKRPAAT
jgi:hypothetical protein